MTVIITLESIEKIKTEKNDSKTVWRILFHQRCKKMATKTVMASRFWLAAYIVRLFDSHFSLGYFSRLKYILACQILHFSLQNVPQGLMKL